MLSRREVEKTSMTWIDLSTHSLLALGEPVQCVLRKGGMMSSQLMRNEQKQNDSTRIGLGFGELAGNEYYCFLDGFSGYFQIPIDPKDQEKTTFTCPYGTFAYRRMPFGLCNAPGTFQRCMMAIFHDMIEKTMEVFMDDFSVFGDSFSTCLAHLEKMLKRCEDTNLSLNWEKSHFMVKEGIVLGHKISKSGLEVDRAKVEVIAKLPHPTSVKGVRSSPSSTLPSSVSANTRCDMLSKFVNFNTASTSGSWTLPSNTITNPKVDLKGITTRSGVAYQGPTIPTTSSSPPKVVERETEVTKDTMPPTNNGSTKDVQPLVVQVQSQVPNSKPVVDPISAPMPNFKTSIPYPSRRNDERRREKANNQIEKFYKIFQDMSFEISLADALILMPKFASTLKALIGNKEKLSEMARTPLNEHCSAVILNKLPEKLGDPGKFLIPCDFPGMEECLALADLGASINLMPLSVWKKLSLPELTPTCMTLELADRSITKPIGIAEDVYLKVGKFKFPADFVVVDFDADPRVPLILGRSFLKTGRALIDVYEGELTLRVGKEAVTFNLDQTSRYSSNYDDMTANRIDVIEMACEEYSQEVLGFSDVRFERVLTTRRRVVSNQGPTIPTTSSSLPKVVERETEVTKDTVPPTNNGSTKDVQPPVVQDQPQVPNSEPVVAPVSAPMPNLKSSIPYPSRRNDERRREKANDQIEKFYEIFKDLSFEISLTDALILMPKFV
ncbi:reverse transcriptase domain-containing protein [Tanacetum coccineum]